MNHFIEMNTDDQGFHYLVIHSGSRNMGKQIAEYWQKIAYKRLVEERQYKLNDVAKECRDLKDFRNFETLKQAVPSIPREELAYVYGDYFKGYLSDMKIAQVFADLNRKAIADVIVTGMGFNVIDRFATIHNYIDMETMILRKGAVSAKLGERLIIPMNMRDGSIIATGKGNLDWNDSAPHGAGRLMGRAEAKRQLNMEDYTESMNGIFTTSVSQSTLDEAPMAYKKMEEIIENTKDTISIDCIIKPCYNYKDSTKENKYDK